MDLDRTEMEDLLAEYHDLVSIALEVEGGGDALYENIPLASTAFYLRSREDIRKAFNSFREDLGLPVRH